MNDNILTELKCSYNHLLNRYYNGCKYCEEHKQEVSRWLPEIIRIQQGLNYFLSQIMEYEDVDSKTILEGFDI